MKLIIGNKNYSSWSLRGWLACKQSGLHFEEMTVPLYGEDWDETKRNTDDIAPSSGKVPILWDGDAVVWDSLAIIEYLADKVGRDRSEVERTVAINPKEADRWEEFLAAGAEHLIVMVGDPFDLDAAVQLLEAAAT